MENGRWDGEFWRAWHGQAQRRQLQLQQGSSVHHIVTPHRPCTFAHAPIGAIHSISAAFTALGLPSDQCSFDASAYGIRAATATAASSSGHHGRRRPASVQPAAAGAGRGVHGGRAGVHARRAPEPGGPTNPPPPPPVNASAACLPFRPHGPLPSPLRTTHAGRKTEEVLTELRGAHQKVQVHRGPRLCSASGGSASSSPKSESASTPSTCCCSARRRATRCVRCRGSGVQGALRGGMAADGRPAAGAASACPGGAACPLPRRPTHKPHFHRLVALQPHLADGPGLQPVRPGVCARQAAGRGGSQPVAGGGGDA